MISTAASGVAEPLLTLRDQTWLWSLGYAMLAILVAAAALKSRREQPSPPARSEALPT